MTTTVHVAPGEGAHHVLLDGDHVAKASVADGTRGFEVFEVVSRPGPPVPPHRAPWTAVLYLVEGRVTAHVDGTAYDVAPGAVLVLPAGRPATFEPGPDGARFVAVTSGDRAGAFFADMARSLPLEEAESIRVEDVLAVTGRHGVVLDAP